jgi:8-oxo-dGTP pyrophosphatase MutT (NUDIX family)
MTHRRERGHRDPVVQAAALPYRWAGSGLQLAVVSTRDGRRWVIPKGHLEPGLGRAGTAVLEAF